MVSMRAVSDLTPHAELGGPSVLPPLADDEFEGLKESVRESGILQAIVVDAATDTIIDGHHRWRAAQEVGLELVPVEAVGFADEADRMKVGVKLNAHRRQMTGEQKRSAIAALLKADPKQSNRAVAGAVGVSDKTVAPVREDMERRAEIPHVSTRVDSLGREQPASKPKPPEPDPPAPEPEPEDHEPDPIAEWERAEKEVSRLTDLVESMQSDDKDRELRVMSSRVAGLEGRLHQAVASKNEAVRTAKYAQGMLRKIRAELGVETDREILDAIRDLKR